MQRAGLDQQHASQRNWHEELVRSADTLIEGESEVIRTIWGLLDHDLTHAGQLSLLLRAMGSPGIDI